MTIKAFSPAEGVTLYLADCRQVMPCLDAVDAIVTDPPYLLTSGGQNSASAMSPTFAGLDDYPNDGELVMQCPWHEWLPHAFDCLKPGCDIYVMANDKNISDAIAAMKAEGFGLHNLLVWRKPNGTPNRWYFKNCEFIAYGWRPGGGMPRTIERPTSLQTFDCDRDRAALHPTQKPVPLMCHYIENSTRRGETVLDPFMGSGTTGVACVKLGRRFVGIELDPEHFDLARKRIMAALHQPDLFNVQPRLRQVPFAEMWNEPFYKES